MIQDSARSVIGAIEPSKEANQTISSSLVRTYCTGIYIFTTYSCNVVKFAKF